MGAILPSMMYYDASSSIVEDILYGALPSWERSLTSSRIEREEKQRNSFLLPSGKNGSK